ncbi:MAG: oligosaccharide flippase family protein [Candidatus Moranbacteria bacterium]|nr:oligosaccharide flippase family protein [Candidatus Moranbacteria bacterium]
MKRIAAIFQENIFVRNSIVLFSGTMVVNVLNYIFHLVVGRMVTPSAYGEIESLISLLAIISVPASTLTLIATKYAADMKAAGNFRGTLSLSKYLTAKVFLYGTPLFLIVLLFTPLVKSFLNIENSLPILLLWCVMFFSFLSAATSGILTGWQKFSKMNLVGILSIVLKLLSVILLLRLGFAVSGVVGSYVLSTLFIYLMNLFLLKKFFQSNSSGEEETTTLSFATLKSYIIPVFYGTLSVAILGNADMIFAKHHLDAALSGGYGALSIAAKTIFFVTGVFTTVLFAMSAEESNHSKKDSRTFRLAVWLMVLVVFFSVTFLSLFPEFVVSVLFGEKYLSVSHSLGWFALAAGIYSLANFFLQYLLSLRETKITLFFLALSGLEIAVLFFFGETFYAIIGITIATQILAVLLGLWFVLKRKHYGEEDLGSYTGI